MNKPAILQFCILLTVLLGLVWSGYNFYAWWNHIPSIGELILNKQKNSFDVDILNSIVPFFTVSLILGQAYWQFIHRNK
jgi:hypothetical protein